MAARKKTPPTAPTPKIQGPSEVRAVDPAQVQRAAVAGLTILNHDQGVIPNKVRRDVEGLERMLQGLASGQLMIFVNPQNPQEEPKGTEGDGAT